MGAAIKKALSAYQREAAKLYKGRGFSMRAATAAYHELKLAYQALPEAERDRFNGFCDFLACNNAVSLAELRAE